MRLKSTYRKCLRQRSWPMAAMALLAGAVAVCAGCSTTPQGTPQAAEALEHGKSTVVETLSEQAASVETDSGSPRGVRDEASSPLNDAGISARGPTEYGEPNQSWVPPVVPADANGQPQRVAARRPPRRIEIVRPAAKSTSPGEMQTEAASGKVDGVTPGASGQSRPARSTQEPRLMPWKNPAQTIRRRTPARLIPKPDPPASLKPRCPSACRTRIRCSD